MLKHVHVYTRNVLKSVLMSLVVIFNFLGFSCLVSVYTCVSFVQ